jgi:hypothetical protein
MNKKIKANILCRPEGYQTTFMKITHNKQTWKGFFTYQEGYESIDQYLEVDFSMELTFTDNSFTGISSDSESAAFFDKPATVKGFIVENTISFVKNYPCNYYKNENGEIVLDRDSKHPDIFYLGFFDEDKKCFSGTWEMTLYEEAYGDDFLEEIANGEFEMRRVL